MCVFVRVCARALFVSKESAACTPEIAQDREM